MVELGKMKNLSGEQKVYSEFLTNLAVAWFSAGVIAPLFTPLTNLLKFSNSLLSIVACLLSLRLAVFFSKGGK